MFIYFYLSSSFNFAVLLLGIENGSQAEARELIGNMFPLQVCTCNKQHDDCDFCGLRCQVSHACLTCDPSYTCA